jgi:hypothetical protein
MVSAIETQGFTFKIGNGDSPLTYTTVGSVVSFSGLDGEAAEIDVTHLQSTAKEYLMGLQDFGNWSLEVNYLPADAGQDLLRAAKASRAIQDFQATLSDGTLITFQGFVKSNPVSGGVDAKVDGSFSIRISGNVTIV